MHFPSALLPLLLVVFPFQQPVDSFRRHHEAAEAHRRAGDPAAAEREYAAILALAYPALGKIYVARGDYARAIAALEAAAARLPDSEEALVNLAIAYFHAGQYRQALTPLDRALARNPRSEPARHMMGKTRFMLGEFAAAARELEAGGGRRARG